MSEYVHKSHNIGVLIYHLVFPAKYRRVIFEGRIEEKLKEICLEIERRYEIKFLEIGIDKDHVHFLIQTVPKYSVTQIVTKIKGITAREIFKKCPKVKKILWGGEFWTDGYFVNTVSKHGNEQVIERYIKGQGKEYKLLHKDYQLCMF